MELETLFTASKWEILQKLSEEPLSPLELAERSSTSLANISQQLRLLEMAGLVTSERISNRDKGQPRIKYRIAADQSYLIAATNNFVEKKLLKLSAYNKVILRIWFYEDPNTRYVLEKAFWRIEHLLQKIDRLSVHQVTGEKVTLCIVAHGLTEKDLPDIKLTNLAGGAAKVAFDLRRNACAHNHLLYARDEHYQPSS